MKEDKEEAEQGKQHIDAAPEKDLEEQGLDGALFDEHSRMKIRIILACAVALGYRHLVLGKISPLFSIILSVCVCVLYQIFLLLCVCMCV